VTSGPPGGGTWTGFAIVIGGVVVAAAIALAIPPLRDAISDAVHGDTESVREDLRDLGAMGILLVVWLAAIHAVVFYPAEILDAAVGFVYGFGPGLALIMACWLLNAVIAYEIGRHAARPLIYRLAGAERFDRAEHAVARGGATLLLAMRLIPIVPFSLFSYAAGAAHVPMIRFMWTTVVGYLPLTAIFVYLGSRLEELSPTDPLLWLSAVALLAMLLAVRLVGGQMAPPEPASTEAGEDP
jgi:uncharacterized membrane protein YdjX (TVP38/TMEM64 family)